MDTIDFFPKVIASILPHTSHIVKVSLDSFWTKYKLNSWLLIRLSVRYETYLEFMYR